MLEETVTNADITKDAATDVAANDDVGEKEVVINKNEAETEAEPKTEDEGGSGDDGGVEKEMATIRKALDKRNRYISNQRQRIRALEAEMAELKNAKGKEAEAPQLEKYESVLDYMKADQDFTLDQKLAEQAKAHQMAQLEQRKAYERAQYDQVIATGLSEVISSVPDAQKLFTDSRAIIEAMPDSVNEMFYEIDDAPAAIYALVKEGRLQDLYSMSPHIAAAHLVQAEIRGQQYLQKSETQRTRVAQQPQPPKPIGSLKGTGTSSTKPLKQMSGDQLMKWLNT